jgi:uncharacterized protein (TIGR03083 family)
MSTLTTAPALDRDQAMDLALEEVRRYAELLSGLDKSQWAAPTECEPWTVRDMAGHVLGNHEGLLSVGARLRQLRDARRHGGNIVDALSATQIAIRAERTAQQVVADLKTAGPSSVEARRHLPRVLRAMRVSVPMRDGNERWSLAYLDDIIYTRDTWMHRIDTCRALGVEPKLTADHDGLIVADIAREWAARHGQAFDLRLSGPAGATFGGGDGGQALELDAVEFCRLLSGRGRGEGLLAGRGWLLTLCCPVQLVRRNFRQDLSRAGDGTLEQFNAHGFPRSPDRSSQRIEVTGAWPTSPVSSASALNETAAPDSCAAEVLIQAGPFVS